MVTILHGSAQKHFCSHTSPYCKQYFTSLVMVRCVIWQPILSFTLPPQYATDFNTNLCSECLLFCEINQEVNKKGGLCFIAVYVPKHHLVLKYCNVGKTNLTSLCWIQASAYPLAGWVASCHWSTERSSAAGHSTSAPPQSQSSHRVCRYDPGQSISDRLLSDQPPLRHKGQCLQVDTSSRLESPCVTKIVMTWMTLVVNEA